MFQVLKRTLKKQPFEGSFEYPEQMFLNDR